MEGKGREPSTLPAWERMTNLLVFSFFFIFFPLFFAVLFFKRDAMFYMDVRPCKAFFKNETKRLAVTKRGDFFAIFYLGAGETSALFVPFSCDRSATFLKNHTGTG